MKEFLRKNFKILLPIAAAVLLAAALLTAILLIPKAPDPAPSTSVAASSKPQVSSQTQSEETSSEAESSEENSSSDTASEEEEIVIPELAVTSPSAADVTVNSPSFVIRGSSDPAEPVFLGETELERDENGYFSYSVTLSEGANWFEIKHKEKTEKFVIRYKKIIVKEVSPSSALTVESQRDFAVLVTALAESTVTATWNGRTITLVAADSDSTSTSAYETYVGGFTAPLNTAATKSYGAVSFKVVSPSGTVTKSSGNIKVKTFDPDKYDGGNGYPKESTYLNVGTTYVAEVTARQGETFNANDSTDLSRPTNNYLPKGTVDYCSPFTKTFTVSGQKVELVTMRYGKQAYKTTPKGRSEVKVYEGSLPATNTVSFANLQGVGNQTVMTFDVDWKAPFVFDLAPQSYTSTSASNRDYTLKNGTTFNVVNITFCYAEGLDTSLLSLAGNPLFESFTVTKREHDAVLSLKLKKTGGFYGWSAEYNEEGQLQFSFLNPSTLTVADNEFGYRLDGITVAVDAGHGGKDNGATGFEPQWHEAQLNLFMAEELKAQLEALGATVIMIRSDAENVDTNVRTDAIRDAKPDFCISVHRNSYYKTAISGFESYHFNAYTASAAKAIYDATMAEGVYKWTANSRVKWHMFFLSRVSDCPVVLTENGYISNSYDYNNMKDPETNKKLCSAMIKGMIDYFLAQGNEPIRPTLPDPEPTPDSSETE